MEGTEQSGSAEPRLCDVIQARTPEILARWERGIRAELAPDLSDTALRDHLPQLLARILHALRDDAVSPEVLPDAHSIARLDEGYALTTVLAELSILRNVILQVWLSEAGALRTSELIRLNEVFDAAVSSTVTFFAEARQRTLRSLDQISAAALGTGELDTFLPKLIDVLQRTSEAVDAVVILLREGDRLRVRAAVGLEGASDAFELRMGESFAGRVAAERTPRSLHVEDEPDRYLEEAALRRDRIRVLYGVPLLHEGQVLGVAHMGSRTSEDFSKADQQLFRAMAQRATSIIVQSQLVTRERKAKRRLDALLTASPVGIGFLDEQLRYVQVNDALATLNGLPAAAHAGRHVSEVLPATLAGHLIPLLEEVRRTGQPRLGLELLAEAGRPASAPSAWLANFFPVRGAEGETLGVGAVVLDITARRQALVTAQQRAAELVAVIQSIPEGVFVGDGGGFTRANRPGLAQLGVERLEELNEDLAHLAERMETRDAATRAPLGMAEQPFSIALEGTPAVREVLLRPFHGGAERVLRCSAAPIRVNGAVVAAVAINTDITEQKRMESSLRDQEERLRLALEAEQAGLFDDDLVRQELHWDDRCKALFGLPPDLPVTAEGVVANLHPEDRPRAFAALLAASDPEVRKPYRIDYRTRAEVHGTEHWLSAQGKVFFSKAGKPLRLIGTVKDITERKRAEAELAQTALFREQFIGVLGHDLRNPLSAIRASAELVLRKPLDPGQEKALSRIVHSSERMSRMISDVLDLARGHLGGGLPLHRQPTHLRELCRRVVDELRVAHPRHRLHLALEGSGCGEWDPDRVAQVISNLVGNALEHGAPDRPVRVKVFDTSDEVTLEVHNEGPPIPEALLPVIFEPFRGTAAGRGRPRSLGLGLYIVQEIVRAHGGAVEVRSSAEDGTTFRVRLPRGPAQP